jgi:hypothetical protein
MQVEDADAAPGFPGCFGGVVREGCDEQMSNGAGVGGDLRPRCGGNGAGRERGQEKEAGKESAAVK